MREEAAVLRRDEGLLHAARNLRQRYGEPSHRPPVAEEFAVAIEDRAGFVWAERAQLRRRRAPAQAARLGPRERGERHDGGRAECPADGVGTDSADGAPPGDGTRGACRPFAQPDGQP
jgi:hypothetical protein